MASRKITNARLSFHDLHEATEFEKGDGKFRYNLTLLIPKGDPVLKLLDADIVEAAKAKLGEKKYEKELAAYRTNSNKFCISDGDLSKYDEAAGHMILSAHRRQADGKPGIYGQVIDPTTGKIVVLTAESGKPYSGCYVNAMVEIWVQDGTYPGVRCGFSSVQFAKDGDAFSGTKQANPDDFEPIATGSDAEALA